MKVKVEITPEARARYLQRRTQEVADCRVALGQKDFELIARVGHTIKGNAETFGFSELLSLAMCLESEAMAQRGSEIVMVLNEIEVLLKKLVS